MAGLAGMGNRGSFKKKWMEAGGMETRSRLKPGVL
jgi:hypothetical protein